jgi:hypothetical protein
MKSDHAAQIFHDWAVSEGLKPDGPVTPLVSTPAEIALLQPVTELASKFCERSRFRASLSTGL